MRLAAVSCAIAIRVAWEGGRLNSGWPLVDGTGIGFTTKCLAGLSGAGRSNQDRRALP